MLASKSQTLEWGKLQKYAFKIWLVLAYSYVI